MMELPDCENENKYAVCFRLWCKTKIRNLGNRSRAGNPENTSVFWPFFGMASSKCSQISAWSDEKPRFQANFAHFARERLQTWNLSQKIGYP